MYILNIKNDMLYICIVLQTDNMGDEHVLKKDLNLNE